MKKSNAVNAPRVAVGAVVFKEGKILLVKRMKAPHKNKWSIPGGSVNLGETLQTAAERETREETGLTIHAHTPIHTFDLIEKDDSGKIRFHYVIVDVEADYIGGRLKPADDALDAGWFGPEDLDRLSMTESTRRFLKRLPFIPR